MCTKLQLYHYKFAFIKKYNRNDIKCFSVHYISKTIIMKLDTNIKSWVRQHSKVQLIAFIINVNYNTFSFNCI